MDNNQKIANNLTAQYPWVKFKFNATPGSKNWAWRYLTSCIVVGGSLESSTLEAVAKIFEKFPTAKDLAKAPRKVVAEIIQSYGVRFHGPKARYITETAKQVVEKHNGIVPNNRKDLEKFPGVGRHVASVVLATVYGQNEFAVDVHVRRIAERLGIVGDDLVIENKVRDTVKPSVWGHFSRSFVDFGQDKCSATPNCTGCTLTEFCNYESGKPATNKGGGYVAVKDFENYNISSKQEGDVLKISFTKKGNPSSCFVRKTGHKLSCTCKGFRFQRKCKHIEMAKDL